MRLISLLIIAILLGCGGETHPILNSAKIYRDKSSNKDKAYEVLSEGLYDTKSEKLMKMPESWFVMGELHFERKEYSKMKIAFDKAVEIEKTREKKIYTDKITKKLDKAFTTLYDQARGKFNSSLEASDNEKKAFLEESKELVTEAMKIDDRLETYIIMGKIKAQLNDETAEQDLLKAIEMDPKNKDVHFDLANYYYNMKKYDKAADMYGKVVELNPNDNDAMKFKAYSYQNSQKYDDAAQAYKDYLVVNPEDNEVKQYLVQILYMTKNYDESIVLSKELIEIGGESENVYNTLISSYYIKINDAITAKDKKMQKELLTDAVAILEAASKKDEYLMSNMVWEALEELYARQGNVKMQKMAAKKVKELAN